MSSFFYFDIFVHHLHISFFFGEVHCDCFGFKSERLFPPDSRPSLSNRTNNGKSTYPLRSNSSLSHQFHEQKKLPSINFFPPLHHNWFLCWAFRAEQLWRWARNIITQIHRISLKMPCQAVGCPCWKSSSFFFVRFGITWGGGWKKQTQASDGCSDVVGFFFVCFLKGKCLAHVRRMFLVIFFGVKDIKRWLCFIGKHMFFQVPAR